MIATGSAANARVGYGTTLCTLYCLILLAGCASAPPGIPVLSGTPALNSLVLVDCYMHEFRKGILRTHDVEMTPTRCALGVDGKPEVVIAGTCWNGQLIFSALEPGPYHLKLIEGTPVENTGVPLYRYVFRQGVHPGLEFTVAEGDFLYPGSISIAEGHDIGDQSQPHTWTFNKLEGTDSAGFSRDAKAEETAWARFLETFGDSPWGSRVREALGR